MSLATATGIPPVPIAILEERRVQRALGGRPHPLDPLTAAELALVQRVCRDRATAEALPNLRFNSVGIKEPNKHEVLRFLADPERAPRVPRRVVAVLQTPPINHVIEAHLDMDQAPPAIIEWKKLPDVQPAVTLDDVIEAEIMLKKNEEFRAVLRARYGITDVESVAADPWYPGQRYGPMGGRHILFFLYKRLCPNDNFYAHPLDLVVTMDILTGKLIEAKAYGAQDVSAPGMPGAVPELPSDFHPSLMGPSMRPPPKPLHIVQPEGPSYELEGNRVAWQHWDFRVGYTWREGLVLYDVNYADVQEGGRRRPVAYRIALSEIIVPYGEPGEPYQKKCAYDAGDYGLGFCANSLELGCDCLGAISYFDAIVNDGAGRPALIKRAICLHEEDCGMAWKHWDYRTNDVQTRRMRRLVISFVSTIANYEYAYYWYLYMDGTIEFEIKLTGIVSTSPLTPRELAEGGKPRHGSLIAPGINAHYHQHFFLVRLDPSCDEGHGGQGLRIAEVEAERMPLGPDNKYGVGFQTVVRDLPSELQAMRTYEPARSRIWNVYNPRKVNPMTQTPVGWRLQSVTVTPPLLAHPTSSHGSRGVFASKHLWVTAYDEEELTPAGFYPLHPDPSKNTGILDWVQKDRPLLDADFVLWINVGLTHVVRSEDFPVMPVERIGFCYKPWNFFKVNPAADIPPEKDEKSVEVSDTCCALEKARI